MWGYVQHAEYALEQQRARGASALPGPSTVPGPTAVLESPHGHGQRAPRAHSAPGTTPGCDTHWVLRAERELTECGPGERAQPISPPQRPPPALFAPPTTTGLRPARRRAACRETHAARSPGSSLRRASSAAGRGGCQERSGADCWEKRPGAGASRATTVCPLGRAWTGCAAGLSSGCSGWALTGWLLAMRCSAAVCRRAADALDGGRS